MRFGELAGQGRLQIGQLQLNDLSTLKLRVSRTRAPDHCVHCGTQVARALRTPSWPRAGYLNERGTPFNPKSIGVMLTG
jgi:hypothetical protein